MDLTVTNQGNCIDCGSVIQQPAKQGRRRERCVVCARARHLHCSAKWKATKATEGKCITCGKDKKETGLRCRPCAKKHVVTVLKSQKRRKAKGKCKCGGIPQEGYTYCPKCLLYARQYREKNKAAIAASSDTTDSL